MRQTNKEKSRKARAAAKQTHLCSHMKRAISWAALQTVSPVLASVCPSSGLTPVREMLTCDAKRKEREKNGEEKPAEYFHA